MMTADNTGWVVLILQRTDRTVPDTGVEFFRRMRLREPRPGNPPTTEPGLFAADPQIFTTNPAFSRRCPFRTSLFVE